jgi:hypothetical protein
MYYPIEIETAQELWAEHYQEALEPDEAEIAHQEQEIEMFDEEYDAESLIESHPDYL